MSEHHLSTPLSGEDIRRLETGDVVFLSGIIYSARDKAHAMIRKAGSPVSLEGAALYHCGPLIQEGRVLSAGPTTSGRMARYTEEMLEKGLRAIIGKGGLPPEPFQGRAVYLAYPGGCGAAAARKLEVLTVHLSELGMAESLWTFRAKDFGPLIVAIDSKGRDLYQEARE
ncbi:MAG: fumarate hydratase [Methanothrix sp.]|nr:fumarate hydratase [Methanothrix sp.]